MSAERTYPSSAYAWFMVIVLTIAYIFSFIDRYILNYLTELIKADMSLTDFQLSLLIGPAFAIFYATMGLPLGVLADRKRRTWIVGAGVFIWSLATAASGLAKHFYHLLIARVFVGVGEATLGPCAMSMISDSFPREKRGKPIAFYTAALSLGAGIASLFVAKILGWAKSIDNFSLPIIGDVNTWQLAFIIVGAPGILLSLVLFMLREPKRQKTAGGASFTFTDAMSHVADRWHIYFSFLAFPSLMTIVAYSQGLYASMFERTWGMPSETYALWNGIILLAVGPLTVITAGWVNDKLYAKGYKDAPLRIVIAGALLIVPTGILAPLMPTAHLALVTIVFNTIGIACASSTGVTGLINITPSEIRGQVVAIYYLTISMAGLLLGPTTAALFSDHVYGNEKLNLALSSVTAMYGIPVLLLIFFALRVYNAEVEKQEAVVA
ncbi:MAG: MFS transporter [Pseudomonadota bacterium]